MLGVHGDTYLTAAATSALFRMFLTLITQAYMLERLNSLWIGDQLGPIEQLSIKSALALGHPYTLYSYSPEKLTGVPAGVDLRNAAEVMPKERFYVYSDSGAPQYGSNIFRYVMQAKGLGCWVDLDFYFLKPLIPTSPFVFGFERKDSINSAILKTPAVCDMLSDLLSLPRKNKRPPWFGPKRTLQYYIKRLVGDVYPQDLPWGTYGPQLVTYAIKKNGLLSLAMPISVFYPIALDEVHLLLEEEPSVERRLSNDTIAIHLWRSKIGNKSIPKNSFLGRAISQHVG